MKLWEKNVKTEDAVMQFTVGKDPEFDKLLAPFDIIASMGHAIMLGEKGLIAEDEAKVLVKYLADYYEKASDPAFSLDPTDEDIHSHLESYLVREAGEAGKKIHTARSRNDQVMTALQLLMKEEWRLLIEEIKDLFRVLMESAEKHRDVLIPGYTHTQVAMPSSIALWLGAYAESLVSDLMVISGIVDYIDQNPLGSAAGFGSSFPIDRKRSTELIGFSDLLVSSASAQLNRGKMEAAMGFGLAGIAETLTRLSADMILYMGQDLHLISFPDELTTGSSIMPHKKNPDVLELIRAHCNLVSQLPASLKSLTANMISGYHRDFQLTKELLFPGIDKVKQCLRMMSLMVKNMKVEEEVLKDPKYRFIYSVEVLNEKVMEGKTFRDAYREVAEEIASGSYAPNGGAKYSHIGSIGNPGLELIEEKMEKTLSAIQIKAADEVYKSLLKYR